MCDDEQLVEKKITKNEKLKFNKQKNIIIVHIHTYNIYIDTTYI